MGNVFPDVAAEAGLQVSALEFLSANDFPGQVPGNHGDAGFDSFSLNDAGDDDFGFDMSALKQEDGRVKSVRGNWLDAFQREHMEEVIAENGYVTAVNSDEAGLYRLFRNLSP